MRFEPLILVVALGGACAPTHAAESVSGTTSGAWVNPSPAVAPIVTTGVGTSSFTWGDASASTTGPNSVLFTATSGGFATVTETAFKVGTITYYNGSTGTGSNPDSVQLALTLDFATPALGMVVSDYTFNIVSTPNSGTPEDAADFLDLPSAFSTTSFLIGTTTYNVKLTGFGNIIGDGFLTSDDLALHVTEGGTASADLFAVVTTEVSAVPEPQNLALMAAALGAMGLLARRRRV